MGKLSGKIPGKILPAPLEYEDILTLQVKKEHKLAGKIHMHWKYIGEEVIVLIPPDVAKKVANKLKNRGKK